jgi:hypothetical protein
MQANLQVMPDKNGLVQNGFLAFQANRCSFMQRDGGIWAGQAVLQQICFKSYRLLTATRKKDTEETIGKK